MKKIDDSGIAADIAIVILLLFIVGVILLIMGSILNPVVTTSSSIDYLIAQFGRYAGIIILAGCFIYLFRRAKEEIS